MVLAGISRDGRTYPQIVIKGMMTGLCYRVDILEVLRQTVRWCNRTQFILMDDNARPHPPLVVEEYLQQETIVRMDWPACSPDLNPIEHVWKMLQESIFRRPVQPTTLVELENVLIEEGNNLEMAAIQRLIGSMRRGCHAVIASRGSRTTY